MAGMLRRAVSAVPLLRTTTTAERVVSMCGASAVRGARFASSSSRNSGPKASRATTAQKAQQEANANLGWYLFGGAVAFVGLSYAAVPLYQMFCQATGYGGTTQTSTLDKLKEMKPVPGVHPITIHFTASTADTMPWKFEPQQKTIKVVPGEPALACYTAYNPTKHPITGVATYNVTPQQCGVYFTKYQCFCFDEQRLRPKEEIDMPLLFWVDPEILEDPLMGEVHHITLSYTFFKTDEEEEEDEDATGSDGAPGAAQQRIEEWKKEAEILTGVDMGANANPGAKKPVTSA